nr:hypothetical protein Iba_chr12bCG11560 [Ipomoea batatas]
MADLNPKPPDLVAEITRQVLADLWDRGYRAPPTSDHRLLVEQPSFDRQQGGRQSQHSQQNLTATQTPTDDLPSIQPGQISSTLLQTQSVMVASDGSQPAMATAVATIPSPFVFTAMSDPVSRMAGGAIGAVTSQMARDFPAHVSGVRTGGGDPFPVPTITGVTQVSDATATPATNWIEQNGGRSQQTTLPSHTGGDHVLNSTGPQLLGQNSSLGTLQQTGGFLHTIGQVNTTAQNPINSIVNSNALPTANNAFEYGLTSLSNNGTKNLPTVTLDGNLSLVNANFLSAAVGGNVTVGSDQNANNFNVNSNDYNNANIVTGQGLQSLTNIATVSNLNANSNDNANTLLRAAHGGNANTSNIPIPNNAMHGFNNGTSVTEHGLNNVAARRGLNTNVHDLNNLPTIHESGSLHNKNTGTTPSVTRGDKGLIFSPLRNQLIVQMHKFQNQAQEGTGLTKSQKKHLAKKRRREKGKDPIIDVGLGNFSVPQVGDGVGTSTNPMLGSSHSQPVAPIPISTCNTFTLLQDVNETVLAEGAHTQEDVHDTILANPAHTQEAATKDFDAELDDHLAKVLDQEGVPQSQEEPQVQSQEEPQVQSQNGTQTPVIAHTPTRANNEDAHSSPTQVEDSSTQGDASSAAPISMGLQTPATIPTVSPVEHNTKAPVTKRTRRTRSASEQSNVAGFYREASDDDDDSDSSVAGRVAIFESAGRNREFVGGHGSPPKTSKVPFGGRITRSQVRPEQSSAAVGTPISSQSPSF